MKIRESIKSDKPEINSIHIKAFGEEKGSEIAELVNDLFFHHQPQREKAAALLFCHQINH